jgi:hypothetical protein
MFFVTVYCPSPSPRKRGEGEAPDFKKRLLSADHFTSRTAPLAALVAMEA